jgi:hypothetical protein
MSDRSVQEHIEELVAEFGLDPDDASARGADTVERYEQ